MNSPNLTQEAPIAEKVGSLIEQIESEVALLRQLYVLSQTESLTLEEKRIDSLDEVVKQKEAIVAELSRMSELLTQKLKSGTTALARATFQERQALAFLKTEGVQLLHQIQRIESSNRLRLEEFKAQSVESSHQLHQELRIHRAYDLSQPQTRQFSELANNQNYFHSTSKSASINRVRSFRAFNWKYCSAKINFCYDRNCLERLQFRGFSLPQPIGFY